MDSDGDLKLFNCGLSEVYNPKFWAELIRLYLIKCHAQSPIFKLNTFGLKNTPQSILIAAYCKGYLFYSSKTKELTAYINQLAKQNVNRII
jgi:hypothetical protein